MKEDKRIQELQKEREYLSDRLEEAAKELARLDLLNLTLTQQKRQAVAAFNFISVMQEKIEEALTIDDLYSNIVKALTTDLFMDSSALVRIDFNTRDIFILASSGLTENYKCLKLDENISKQEVLNPTFVNSKSSLHAFHTFVVKSFEFPFFIWHPIVDEEDGLIVLFAGNRFEDLVSKQPFSDANLETFRAISSVISLRRANIANIQERLRREKEKIDFLAEVLKASPIAVIATDIDGMITYANPATGELYGYREEDLISKDPGMLNAEPNAGEIQKEIADTVRQEKVWRGELLNKKKNGDLFYIHASIYPVIDKEGNFIAFVGFQEDITERKKTEEALWESEKKYRDLVNNALVGIYTTNLKGDILYVNEALSKMLEFGSPEDMMAEGVSAKYKNPKDREVLIEKLSKMNRVESFEIELLTKTGKTKDVLLSATLEGDMISGMIMDITERQKAEQALKESEEKFRNLAEKSPNMIFINLKGRLVYVNEKCEETMEYKKEEFYSPDFDFRTLIASEFIDLINNNFRRHMNGKEVDPYEYVIITKTNKKIEVIITTKLIEYRGEKAILGIITDITEHKQAEEALRESKELFEKVFFSQHDAIFILDSATPSKIIDCNPGVTKVFGYTRQEIVGKTTDIIHVDDTSLKEFRKYLYSAIDERGFLYLEEFQMRRKDGTVFPTEHSVVPLEDKQDQRIGWVSVVRDITERKQAQEQLQSLSRRLIEVQESERRFLASELHDQIGQNLTALSINLNVIRSRFSEEVDIKIVDRLEDSLKLVGETIERIRSVMAELRPPVLDDYGLAVALRWYTERFSERNAVVTVVQEKEFISCLPLTVETALFRIVQEVLTNVSKHANAKHVIVTLERIDGVVQLVVSDDGVGFDPSVLKKFKKHPGWGLITIEERAKAMGGNVYVKSEPDKGTQVIVQIPC